ncbi:BTAD domain-containing putative transcriptional regulator [Nocardia sp. NPDC050697]|uniref:BTAD domain-containing putative transcriptional regulator n=1 Tax=Nocardia sp. NPDC050697 TaxID=3155158 RepID=UPI0033CB54C0
MGQGSTEALVRGWSGAGAPAVAVLGPLAVRGPDGAAIPIPARKQAELLVILAAERTTRGAGYLCELLWRGHPPESATVTLQGYVSRLRKALRPVPELAIETGPNGYALRCSGSGTDLDLLDLLTRDARAAHAAGDVGGTVRLLEPALALWRGEPLADVADIAELAPERARLSELRAELTELCAEGLLVLGRPAQAVTLLTGGHEQHPHREGTARLLALALRDCGRTSEALDLLVRLRRALRDDLGLDPAPDTARVERELRAPAPPPRASTGRASAPDSQPPGLVGRAEVAALLDRAWARTAHGRTVVLVRGEPGIGKTAVVTDALRRHGDRALVTTGSPDPLATLTPWLDQAALAGRDVPDTPAARPLAALLAEIARETGRAVAVLDDVQQADAASLRIIAAVARVLRAHPVLLILTQRPGPLPGPLGALGDITTVDLPPLPDAAVAELVRAALPDAELHERIVATAAGSPFIATQLCDRALAGRPLDAVPVDLLSPRARELAELLALIGPSAPVGLFADIPEFDAIAAELGQTRTTTITDGTIAFTHDLVRTAVLDTIGPLRAAPLHARIADALAAGQPDALAAQARHRCAAALDTGDERAAAACLAAAARALRDHAPDECAEFAERGRPHASRATAVELDLLAGQANHRLGRFDAAARCFDRAARHADPPALARIALRAAPHGVAGYFSGYGVVQSDSSGLRARALAHRLELDPDAVAEVEAVEATDRAVHGLPGDLDALAEAKARSAPGSRSWPQVLLAEFVCTWEPGTLADRTKLAEELAELAGADHTARATALHLRRVCALESGDLRLVRRLSAEFTRLAADGGTDLAATQLWWDVMLAVLRGDYDRSRALMARFAADLGPVDERARLLAEASLLTSGSIELWHRGRLGEVLAEADRMATDFDEDFALVVAMAAAETGDRERALAAIESVLAVPGRWHGPRVAVRVPLLAEALLALGRTAPELRERVRGYAAGLEPLTRGWGAAAIVQWPGLVCLGPSGLYSGTLRGILGLPGAHEEVAAAQQRSRELGAHPYERRAAERRTGWPFTPD